MTRGQYVQIAVQFVVNRKLILLNEHLKFITFVMQKFHCHNTVFPMFALECHLDSEVCYSYGGIHSPFH